MAERRMFSKNLMRSSAFMRLSRAALQLYLYLCLEADDDGFGDNVDTVLRMCRCSRKHLQELLDGGWVIGFDSGVIAIVHWHRHNQIKKDRYKQTDYRQERSMLDRNANGDYVRLDPECIQSGSNLEPQYS